MKKPQRRPTLDKLEKKHKRLVPIPETPKNLNYISPCIAGQHCHCQSISINGISHLACCMCGHRTVHQSTYPGYPVNPWPRDTWIVTCSTPTVW